MMSKVLVEFTDMVNKNLYSFIDVKQGARLKRRLVHRAIINHQYQGKKKKVVNTRVSTFIIFFVSF
jgi:hypothetical protein